MDKLKSEVNLKVRCPQCGNAVASCDCVGIPVNSPQNLVAAPLDEQNQPGSEPQAAIDLGVDTRDDSAPQRLLESANQALSQAQSAPDASIGKVLGGKYQILSRLGAGGMSVVYKARHLLLQRDVVVKLVSQEKITDQKAVMRLAQEAKAAALLSHPNIVNTREFGIAEDGYPYIVMDFAAGKPLSEIIEKDAPIAPERAVSIILQICDGLAHAHEKGVIHRDIKPGNIMVATDAEGKDAVKIADFGIAKITNEEAGLDLTRTGEVFGSPLYMSPEQCRGRKLDARSDIYSLGCVMCEMLTGQPPYKSDSALETLMLHVNPEPPELKKAMPADLEKILFRALEKDPQKRYQTIAQMGRELEAADLGRGGASRRRRKRSLTPKQVVNYSVAVAATAVALSLAHMAYTNSTSSWKEHLRFGQQLAMQRRETAAEKEFKIASSQAEASVEPQWLEAQTEINEAQGDMYWNQWKAEYVKGAWNEAWNAYNRSWSYAERGGSAEQKAHVLEALARMCYESKDNAKAEKYYDRAKVFREQDPGEKKLLLAGLALRQGMNYGAERKYEQSDRVLRQALGIFKETGADQQLGFAVTVLRYLASNAIFEERYSAAAKYYDEAIDTESKRPSRNEHTLKDLRAARSSLPPAAK